MAGKKKSEHLNEELVHAVVRKLHYSPNPNNKSRVQLYVDAAELAKIDAAAKALGESRSEYMMKASLARAGEGGAEFTEGQLKAIRMEAIKIVAEYDRETAKTAAKLGNEIW